MNTIIAVLLVVGLTLALLGWAQLWFRDMDTKWEAEARRLLPELYDEDHPA